MNTFYGSVLHIYAFLTHRCLKFQMEASRILRVYGSSSISKELFWSVEFAATFSQISEYHELWQPTPVSLPGESHGQRSLAGYSPWGHKELDMTEHSWTLSTFTDKHTGKNRQPLVMKDGPDTGHTKHKYSDFSSNFTYLSPPASFFLRFKFTGAAHRNNNSVFQAPENFPWHNQLIYLNMMVDSLEEETAAPCSIVAWRIPWTEEPGGLYSTGCKQLDTSERPSASSKRGGWNNPKWSFHFSL